MCLTFGIRNNNFPVVIIPRQTVLLCVTFSTKHSWRSFHDNPLLNFRN
jgi:hypothetical protein